MLVNVHKLILFAILLLVITNQTYAQVWSLQKCIDTAQVYNKNLQVAKNNNHISNEKQSEASAYLLPKLSITADYKYFGELPTQLMPLSTFTPTAPDDQFKEAQFGVPHNIGANVQMTLTIYNPQIYGGIQTAKIAREITQLQYKKTEEQVYSEISNLYYNAQLLTAQNIFADSNIINSEKLLKNMRLLKEQQMANGTDVGKVELQLSQLQTQKANVASRLQQVMNVLKYGMGISQEGEITVSPDIRFDNEIIYSSNNPTDIQIASVQNKLASTELKNIKKSRLPSVSFIASYGTTGFGYDKQPNDFLKFFPVSFTGIQINFPLFTGTITQRKINQKKKELKNSEILQSIAIEQTNIQIQNTTMQRSIAKHTITTYQLQISQAQSIYDQSILLQKQGLVSLTDVLLADTALREAQTNYLTAIVDYLKADIELKRLTGNISTNKQ